MNAEAPDRISHALLSPDEKHRLSLIRGWDMKLPPFVVIGLNPSTADATEDDPTIRRCVGFARREGCGSLVMLNLFTLRATDPAVLHRTPQRLDPEADPTIAELLREIPPPRRVVCAWGVGGAPYMPRVATMLELLHGLGCDIACFGLSRAGHPRHPLYLAANTPIVPWLNARGMLI